MATAVTTASVATSAISPLLLRRQWRTAAAAGLHAAARDGAGACKCHRLGSPRTTPAWTAGTRFASSATSTANAAATLQAPDTVARLVPYSALAESIPRSGIRDVMAAADKELQAGRKLIRLEAGQPDVATAPHIVEAVRQAALKPESGMYIHNAGLWSLREAIAQDIERQYGVPTTPEHIVVTTGATLALTATLLALVDNPGDEVLVSDPAWPNYAMGVSLAHGTIVRYPCPASRLYQPDPAEVEALITPRTKALMLCSPSNPTGRVLPKALLEELLAVARRHGLYVISDEIYSRIVFDGGEAPSALPIAAAAAAATGASDALDGLVLINGFSKFAAMCGYRVGYLRASESMVALLIKLCESLVSCGTPFVQEAAIAALQGPQEHISQSVARYQRRRDIALDVLRANGLYEYTPEGAFYLLVSLGAGVDSHDFTMALLRDYGVAVAPGATFGSETSEQIRLSLASSDEDVREGMTRICAAIKAL